MVGIELCNEGVVEHTLDTLNGLNFLAPAPIFSLPIASSPMQTRMSYYEEGEEDDNYCGEESSGTGPAEECHRRDSQNAMAGADDSGVKRRTSSSLAPKFNWATVFGEDPALEPSSEAANSSGNNEVVHFDASGPGVVSADNFTFYDMSSEKRSNEWAGAAHWKFGLRARTAAAAPSSVAPEVTGEKKKNSRKLKEKLPLVFTTEAVDESYFKAGKAAVLLSAAALKKAAEAATAGALTLPPDAHLEPKDLCRLFLRPRMLVVPPMLTSMLCPASKRKTSQSAFAFSKEEDVYWGAAISEAGPSNPTREDRDDDDEGHGDYLYDNDDGDNDTGDASGGMQEEGKDREVLSGLQIAGLSKMAQGVRQVQRIDIGYATASKRVSIIKLKKDLWKRLLKKKEGFEVTEGSDLKSPSSAASTPLRQRRNSDRRSSAADCGCETISFQTVVSDLSQQQQQSGITVSFYFIGLLHLANEKVYFFCLSILKYFLIEALLFQFVESYHQRLQNYG